MPSTRLGFSACMLTLAACTTASDRPTAPTLPAAEVAEAPAVVAVAGTVAADVGPPLGPLQLTIHAQATDAAGPLAGGGGHLAFFGLTLIERSTWDLTAGTVHSDGSVTLQGTIAASTAGGLVNAPLMIQAGPTGVIAVTIGPIPGGPFAGDIQTFTGSGAVTIR